MLEDLFIKPIYLIWRKDLIREQSHAEQGYKKLRRVAEVVAETICQTVLQIYLVIQIADGNISDVNPTTVYVSLAASVFVLVLWGYLLLRVKQKKMCSFLFLFFSFFFEKQAHTHTHTNCTTVVFTNEKQNKKKYDRLNRIDLV